MNEKNIVQWSQDESTAYLESFRKYANIMDKLFVANAEGTEAGLNKEYGNNIRRALLTKGDFTMRIGSNMTFLVNKSNARGEGTWKRLFRPQKGQDIITKRGYFKDLLDDPLFDINDINDSCEKIIKAYHCDNLEYKYFIEIKEVMDFVIDGSEYDKSKLCWNFFRDVDQTKFLLGTTRLSGFNMDYYKYALYCKLKKESKGSSRLSFEDKSGIDEVIREPIVIEISETSKYCINLIRETKQFRLIGGKNNVEIVKDSLESMVKYIEDNQLLEDSYTE
jgi:hypothetical protein